MDCLPEELLCEILCKLPWSKSAIRCRVVCKRWFALISCPYFIHTFVKYKTINLTTTYPTIAALIAFPRLYHPEKGQILCPTSNTDSGCLKLEPGFCQNYFLPDFFAKFGIGGPNSAPVKVVATCNDLVVCSRGEYRKDHDFFICNFQIMQWIILPRPPSSRYMFVCALACHPYLLDDNNVNTCYKYRVVLADQHEVKMFYSETCKWEKVKLLSSKPVTFNTDSAGMFFDGMLYFPCNEGMVAFNQFMREEDNDDDNAGVTCIRSHIIDQPTDHNLRGFQEAIGICDRSLRMIRTHPGAERPSIYIWKLIIKEHGCEWQREQFVELSHYLFGHLGHVTALGFHPFNANAVLLQSLTHNVIVMCDLQRRSFNFSWAIPKECQTLPGGDTGKSLTDCFLAFWLTHPWWPTPLPKLT